MVPIMDSLTSAAQANGAISGLGASVWPILFFAVLLFFLVYSAVLIYHWFTFSMNKRVAVMATVLYTVISAVFVFSMLSSVVTLVTL